MISKYGFAFEKEVIQADKRRLINQIWKLIPMKENEENWKEHLNILIEEIVGLNRIFSIELNYLILLSKLEGLYECENFMLYRKTVFRCIDLLSRVGE